MSDALTSREYKTILKKERFSDAEQGVSDFWERVGKHTTAILEEPWKRKERLVWYSDTTDHQLKRKHSYSFRERRKLDDDGKLEKRRKVSLKFRADSEAEQARLDFMPTKGKEPDQKFETDVILDVDAHGAATDPRVRYSRSGAAEFKMKEKFRTIADVALVFPVLRDLGLGDAELKTVRKIYALEHKFENGRLALGDCEAEVAFTVWYESDRKASPGDLLLAEFSFDFDISSSCDNAAHEEARRVLKSLGSADWMKKGGETKTEIVYGPPPE